MTSALDSTAIWLGASEMGRRIAEFNWLDHPLGPIENWSHSLKTTIQIMLNSRYAMWMGWGSELYFFCNDAYLPTVGIKESWVLGTPARKVWAEIWSDVGPRAESVVQTGKPTWDESLLLILERSGFPEETYHTFSYSPIPDDSGNIGGMLCVVTEETERVIGERRLAILRELGVDLTGIHSEQRLMEAIPCRFSAYQKDLPFSLIYLLDADGCQARLSCSHGIHPGNSLAQSTIDVDDDQCLWPARRVIAEKIAILVEDLTARIQQLPTGPWPTPPQQAVVVPIARQGHERPAGFMVAGISSYRRFDDDYLGFIQLLAGQIGAGLSSARAYDEERQRAEMIAELDRAKTTFFSNVSHEFRTPLTLMLGPLDETLADGQAPLIAAQHERLEIAQRNGVRLLNLVNTLFDFSRIEAQFTALTHEAAGDALGERASAFSSARAPRPRVLVADDNSDMRDYMTRLLGDDFDIEAVTDGESALAAVHRSRPDLILSDVMMPKLDGLQLLRRLRDDADTRSLPVILLSARAGESSRVEGLAAGADDYLVKPFSAGELRARVAGMLGLAAMREKADLSFRTSAEERQMFVSLVEKSQDFIAMAALNGDVFYVNRAGRMLLGLQSAEDVELASILDYFPVTAQQVLESTALPTAFREGRWEGEAEFQHRHSAKSLPIHLTIFLIRGSQSDAPLCLAIVARDISAQKLAEAELRASEQRYRELVHGLPAAVYTCDAQGRITLCNEAAVELWGRAPELGKDSWCGSVRIYRLDGTVLPLDQCPMAMALKHGRPVKGEEIIIERPDGTRRNVLPHPQPLLDAHGTVIGAIDMLIDITERKVTEDALRASEERLRLATEAGTLGVWDWDIAHNRVTWTESLYPIHGLEPGEFGGTVESFSQLVHPDDRPKVSQAIASAVNDEAPFELEFRILRPSGEVVWIFTNAKVLRENGRAVRMVGATVDISERKRSEHALRESEERISQLIALMPAAIYTCDADGHITFFNRRAAELWGREPRRGAAGELFTGTYRLWQPDGTLVARDQTPMAAAVRSGQSVRNAELIIERPDGTRVVVSANIEPLHDRYGRNSGAISVFQDISERKNAERELRDRNEAIQLLSETLEQLLRANDAETIVRNVFDKVAAHVGADSYFNFMVNGHGGPLELRSCFGVPDEIVEKISRLDSGQAICGTAGEAHQAIAANNIQNSDDEKVTFARSVGLQSYVCNPLMVGDNLFGTLAFASHTRRFFDVDHLEFLRIVSQYTAIALDRLRNAKALRSSEDQLAEELTSMQQLHAMTTRLIAARDIPAALNEILDAVIAIQGADFGKVRVYNPALNGLEIVAQRGFEQSFIDRFRVVTVEDDSASGMAIRTKSRVVIEDVETEADYTPGRKAAALGGYRAVQATPLISRNGDLLGLLLSHFRHPRRPTARELRFVDLYARQAADFIELLHTKQELHDSEERLRRQANELEQQLIASGRLVSLGEITASMAHEFNNPLGIVLGFVEDLLNSTPSDDPIHRPLQIIDDEAQRCKRIIQDLMDYSRPHSTHLSQTKIPDLISKTLKLIENRLYKQKIKLTTEIAADLPRVHADYQQLEQVMVNLYLNAIDAMPRGGELAISAQAHGSNGTGSVAIAVTDTGFGIDEETLARIFQPFYTAKKTRGLGLGLPICERIVKNHGGRIDVESQVGQGTTFKVIIPLTQGTA